MSVRPKLVIVDTNCYVRLYCSPVRPILGSVISGYRLMTLVELQLEAGNETGVAHRYPWLRSSDIQQELAGALLKLREPKKTHIEAAAKIIRKQGDAELRRYCKAVNTVKLRELSAADARALAAADVLAAALATDEWPLRHVAGQLLGGPEGVQLFTSVGVMHLMERAGKLTRDMRITTMRGWLASGEALHRQCGDEYRDCFGEEPPDGQSASSHKA